MHLVWSFLGVRFAPLVPYTGESMTAAFASPMQEHLYLQVVQGLRDTGYTGDLLQEDYPYRDWFDEAAPRLRVSIAAFARTPPSYSTACFAAFLNGNRAPESEVLSRLRALGAPFAFEIGDEYVSQWSIGRDPSKTKRIFTVGPDELESEFAKNTEAWSGAEILRLKNIGFKRGYRQLDFIDIGLIPALEEHVRTKLDIILKDSLASGVNAYRHHFGRQPDAAELFRLTFSLLAAKVLHDRGVGVFPGLSPANLSTLLREVEDYYPSSGPVLDFGPSQRAIADALWGRISFENLTIEVLAYIWEHSFVTPSDRQEHGIYGTPYELARHLVYSLLDDQFALDRRPIVEPCCGHGIFLVAALQRLRELLPADMLPEHRHAYFAETLRGFDRDPFAIEVARLCLSLADFPNRNGWDIKREDVFKSNVFESAIRQSKVVFCNPPFRDFTPTERSNYPDRTFTPRPAELLHRVLKDLPSDGILGFVLPRKFTDGREYKSVRRQIAQRFDDVEIVAMPDDVFQRSEVETTLLICKHPSVRSDRTSVSFVDISDQSWSRFGFDYIYPAPEVQVKAIEEAAASFEVFAPEKLGEAWVRLDAHKKVSDVAEVHRGVEWKPLPGVPPGSRKGSEYKSRYRATYTSSVQRPGFVPGVASSKGMLAFIKPAQLYLSSREEDRLHPVTFEHRWNDSKVIVGAARGSRGRWRIKAAADHSGLLLSQRFVVLWPNNRWTANSLAAVLNGPVACAYVATRETTRDVRVSTIQNVPIPRLSDGEISTLDGYVREYTGAVSATSRVVETSELSRLLLRIDAIVLKGYNLSPRIERSVLDYFHGSNRPVGHRFDGYFPPSFGPRIPLWMYLAHDFSKVNARYFIENIPSIDDPDLSDALSEVE
jgi:hypothetical protein